MCVCEYNMFILKLASKQVKKFLSLEMKVFRSPTEAVRVVAASSGDSRGHLPPTVPLTSPEATIILQVLEVYTYNT